MSAILDRLESHLVRIEGQHISSCFCKIVDRKTLRIDVPCAFVWLHCDALPACKENLVCRESKYNLLDAWPLSALDLSEMLPAVGGDRK